MEFLTSQLHSFSVTGSVPLVPVDVQLEILLADCGLHLSKGGHQVAVVDGPEENDLHAEVGFYRGNYAAFYECIPSIAFYT